MQGLRSHVFSGLGTRTKQDSAQHILAVDVGPRRVLGQGRTQEGCTKKEKKEIENGATLATMSELKTNAVRRGVGIVWSQAVTRAFFVCFQVSFFLVFA